MRFLLPIALVCILVPSLAGQNKNLKLPGEVKEWQTSVMRGEIEIMLSSFSRRGHPWNVISIDPVGDGSISTVSEQVELIRRAMLEMPSLGYRPEDLGRITVNLLATDFQDRLNQEVTRSGKWRGCIGYKHCWAIANVMAAYLDSHGIYGPLDALLRANGLRIGALRIEGPVVAIKGASQTSSHGKVTAPTTLSCTGTIYIDVEWKDGQAGGALKLRFSKTQFRSCGRA